MVYFARFRYGLSVPMSGPDIEKTAFATPRGGLYQYTVMPFGLCNAPPVYKSSGMEQRNREPKNNDCGTHNSFSWNIE